MKSLSGLPVRLIALCCLLTALAAPEAAAQSFWRKNDRNTFIRNIQFNFNIPSARAIGLGGAFVAIADDATAGMANPAGLTILTKPEISVHYKLSRFHHTEFAATEEDHDRREEFTDDVGSQSYLSLVYPRGKFAFSLYRQELINFESSYDSEGFGNPFQELDPDLYALGNRTSSDIEVQNWGIALAYTPRHNLSIGVSNIISALEFRFQEQLFQRHPQTERPVRTFSLNNNSTDIRYSINVGVKYEPHPDFTLGGVFRSGPRFDITNTIEDVNLTSTRSDIRRADRDLVFKVPDVYSFGAAYRPLDNLTLSLDLVRVEYSDLIGGFDRNLKDDDVGTWTDDFPYSRFVDLDGVDDLVLSDATELHIGAEYYLMWREMAIPIRAGLYTDPSHVVHTTVQNVSLRRLFPPGEDQVHFTCGFGFVLQNKIQLDTAVNFSDNVSEALLSAVFRF